MIFGSILLLAKLTIFQKSNIIFVSRGTFPIIFHQICHGGQHKFHRGTLWNFYLVICKRLCYWVLEVIGAGKSRNSSQVPRWNSSYPVQSIQVPPWNSSYPVQSIQVPPWNSSYPVQSGQVPPWNWSNPLQFAPVPPWNLTWYDLFRFYRGTRVIRYNMIKFHRGTQ